MKESYLIQKLQKLPEFKNSGNVLVPQKDIEEIISYLSSHKDLSKQCSKLREGLSQYRHWSNKMARLDAALDV